MALRQLALAAAKGLHGNGGHRHLSGTLRVFSRGLLDDLSSLLDENVRKTGKSESADAAPQKKAESPKAGKQAQELSSLLGWQVQPKPVEAENVASEEEETKPAVELLPEFASDEELIQYVTGILMDTHWRELYGKLAPLGNQLKGHHVTEILKRAQDSDVLFSFFRWVRARKYIALNNSALQLLFAILSSRDQVNKPDEMQWLLVEMHAKGMKMENSMFVTVMQTYARMNKVRQACKLFWKMDGLGCSPKTPTYNAILKIFLDAGCNLDFDMVHSKLKFSGREFDIATYELLLEKTCKAGKADDAYQVFQEMKTKFKPSARAYALLVRCMTSAGKEQLAMEIVQQMEQQGDEVHNLIVMNLIKSGKLTAALEEYKKMLETGFKPESTTCISILNELVITEKTTQACTLFGEMTKAGYISPSDVLPLVRMAYLECKVEIVFGFLKDMSGKGCPFDAETIHALVEGIVVKKRIDMARRLFRSVMDAGKKPLAATYNLFIKNSGSVDSSKQMFDLMKHNKCTPDMDTYHLMLESLINGGLYPEGLGFFNEMMDKGYGANAVTYKLVLELLGKDPSAGLDTVVETLTTLKDKGGFELAARYLEKLSSDKLLPPIQTKTGKEGKILVKILQKDGKKFDDLYM